MRAIKSLSNTYFFYLIFIVFFAVGIPTVFWMYDHYSTLKTETARLESKYVASQKALIKSKVDEAYGFITFKKSQTHIKIRNDLKKRVYEAYHIAIHLYNKYKNKLSEKDLESLIIEAIRPLRFNDGRGYFFATAFNGIEKLFADRPELEGQNLMQMQDMQGKFVIKEMIRIARDSKEGFIKYTWTKPEAKGSSYPKLAFVKHFEPFDWFIGTGEYLDVVEDQMKQEALEHIGEIRFGNDGYVFVMDYNSKMLSHILTRYIGQSMEGVTAPDGFKIDEALIEAAKKPNGDFLTYIWYKPSAGKNVRKISYSRGFDAWQWVVAAGVYLDDIEPSILEIQARAQRKLLSDLGFILSLFCILIFFSFVLARYLSQRIKNEFKLFLPLFERGTVETVSFDKSLLTFDEFKTMVDSANDLVAKRLQAEAESMQTEERYIQLFKEARDGLLIVELDGSIVDANQALLDIFGYSREAFMALNMSQLYHQPADRKKLLQSLKQDNAVTNYVMKMRRKDQSLIECHISASVRRNKEGDVIGYQGIFRDITKQKEIEEKLQHSQKLEAIGTLAGGIAHDFNNILFGISGFVELSQLEVPDGSKLDHNLKQISKALNRASGLVKQILAFSRQTPQVYHPLQMKKIVEEAIKLLRASIPAYIEIKTDIQSDAIVMADPTQMHQVLMNLCTNGWLAMQEQRYGILKIGLYEHHVDLHSHSDQPGLLPGAYIRLCVEDSGKGIAPEIRDRIFDPYFTTRKAGDGSGLGLAMAHGIVKNHGGILTFESEIGKGAVFNVILPQTVSDQSDDKNIQSLVPGGNEHVLYVDDEKSLGKVVKDMLERFGYKTTIFSDSVMALEEIRRAPDAYDILVSDLTMPQMTGDVLAKEVYKIRPRLPIILCTGYNDEALKVTKKETSIRLIVIKPITAHELGVAIRKVLDS